MLPGVEQACQALAIGTYGVHKLRRAGGWTGSLVWLAIHVFGGPCYCSLVESDLKILSTELVRLALTTRLQDGL